MACGDEDPAAIDAWIAANEPERVRVSDVSVTAEFRCWRWTSDDGAGLSVATLDGERIVGVDSFAGEIGQGEHIEAVRAYQAAWADLDDTAAWLEKGFAEDGRFVDPSSDVTGRDELVAHIQDTMKNPLLKRFSFTEVGGMDVVDDTFRFHWDMGWTKSGDTVLSGYDYGRLDEDGRVTLLVGCWE